MKKLTLLIISISLITSNCYANSFSNDWQKRRIIDDRQIVYDYTGTVSGAPIYIGFAAKAAATSADSWRVYKFTDSAAGPTARKTADGIWDNRTSLTYY